MITPQGVVKVLDSGLAKAAGPEPSGNPAESPTLTISPTRAGDSRYSEGVCLQRRKKLVATLGGRSAARTAAL
jgi:hypothetical protein